MKLSGDFEAVELAGDDIEAELRHPQLVPFDRIRALLAMTDLPPQPAIYTLLWRYVVDDNHALSRAIDFAIMTRTLDLRLAMTLHETYCVSWHDD